MSAPAPAVVITEAGPGLGHLAGDDRLRSVLAATLRAHGLPVLAPADATSPAVASAAFWPASFFELERLTVFREAGPDTQDAIVPLARATGLVR